MKNLQNLHNNIIDKNYKRDYIYLVNCFFIGKKNLAYMTFPALN